LRYVTLSILAAAIVVVPLRAFPNDQDAPRIAAERFGAALTSARPSALREVLPNTGKIRLSLRRLGPEEGAFASGHVEVVFRDFLSSGSVRTFTVVTVDSDGRTAALAVARAEVIDRDGRAARVGFRLALEPEHDRWVLREVRETTE